jgi:hypothetical protein
MQRSEPWLEQRQGRLYVQLARTLSEVRAAQRLRYDVFATEMGARLNGPEAGIDEEPTGHRPLDYWGRNLIDHFLRLLPSMLAPEGTAFLMQLSIIGQAQTEALLAEHGLAARVVDYSFFPFEPVFEENRAQIERVEQLSDAYHIKVADEDRAVQSGSMVYVAKQVEHRFHSIEEELSVLVFFAPAEYSNKP